MAVIIICSDFGAQKNKVSHRFHCFPICLREGIRGQTDWNHNHRKLTSLSTWTTALSRWTFVGKVMSLLFNMLSRFVITFLPRSKHFLISWLQSPFAVILEPRKIKPATLSTVYPSICHEMMGPDAMMLVFWMLSFKPTFSLSSFTFIKRLFSSSSLSAIRVVSSAYLRLLRFLPAILIPACVSSSPVFLPVQCFSWCTLHIS